jgi:hypothetical protein
MGVRTFSAEATVESLDERVVCWLYPSRRASHQRAGASGQASKLSAQRLLQHLLVQAQIGDHLT